MVLLSSIIAKVLAITDAVLGFFVVTSPLDASQYQLLSNGDPIACGSLAGVNTQLTDCGTLLVDDLGSIAVNLVHLIPSILSGLFAIK